MGKCRQPTGGKHRDRPEHNSSDATAACQVATKGQCLFEIKFGLELGRAMIQAVSLRLLTWDA